MLGTGSSRAKMDGKSPVRASSLPLLFRCELLAPCPRHRVSTQKLEAQLRSIHGLQGKDWRSKELCRVLCKHAPPLLHVDRITCRRRTQWTLLDADVSPIKALSWLGLSLVRDSTSTREFLGLTSLRLQTCVSVLGESALEASRSPASFTCCSRQR